MDRGALVIFFYCCYFLKGPWFKYSHVLRPWGLDINLRSEGVLVSFPVVIKYLDESDPGEEGPAWFTVPGYAHVGGNREPIHAH